MQISCENCSATYTLDDRLIPPGGAPVQCTQCGHVFTARLGGEVAPPPRVPTRIFGAPVAPGSSPGTPAPVDLPPEDEALHKTLPYGRVPVPAPAAPAPPPPPRTTQMFGAVGPGPSPGHSSETPAHLKTLVFGGTARPPGLQPSAPPVPQAPPPAPPTSTRIFGAVTPPAAPSQPRKAPTPADPIRSTQIFGAVPAAPPPEPAPAPPGEPVDISWADEPEEDDGAPLSIEAPPPPAPGDALAGLQRTPDSRHVPISLPPEGPPPMDMPAELGREERVRPGAEALGEPTRGSNRTALIAVLLVALGASAFFGYRVILARKAIPQATIDAVESAFSLLRRDDAASQDRAIEELSRQSQAWPALIEARADLALALAIRADDVRVGIKRIELQAEILRRRMVRLQEEKSPTDWQNRVNAMLDEQQGLLKQIDPLTLRAKELDARVGQLLAGLPVPDAELGPRDALAVLRTRAICEGLKGSEQAIILSERYRSKGARDGWDAIAFAEFALNTRVPPDTLGQARTGLDALIAQDSAFLRAYVLSARLSLQQQRYDLAANALEATMALNPAHELAPKLLSWVHEAQRAEATGP